MNQSIKKQFLMFSLYLLPALPTSITSKEPIQAKNAQELLMLQTAENQAMLIKQQEIQQKQQAMLMAMFETWQAEEMKKRAEIERIQAMQQLEQKRQIAHQDYMNNLSTEMPVSWVNLDASATPMCPFIEKRFNKACIKITNNPTTLSLALLYAKQQGLGFFASFLISDTGRPYLQFFKDLNATPEDIVMRAVAHKHGIDYDAIQDTEIYMAENAMTQNLESKVIHTQLCKDPEYLQTLATLKEIEEYGNAVFLDDTLQKKHHDAIAKIQHMKNEAIKKHNERKHHLTNQELERALNFKKTPKHLLPAPQKNSAQNAELIAHRIKFYEEELAIFKETKTELLARTSRNKTQEEILIMTHNRIIEAEKQLQILYAQQTNNR